MTATRYIDRLRKMDRLIRTKSTGNPSQMALKLGVSERCVYYSIREMKELGAPVRWSFADNSYIYERDGRLSICFEANIKT